MNLRKIFGRAKKPVAAVKSSRSTSSTLSSLCSPPFYACSVPSVQMSKLRMTTNRSRGGSVASSCSKRSAVTVDSSRSLRTPTTESQVVADSVRQSSSAFSDVLLASVRDSPASDQREPRKNAEAAGDGVPPQEMDEEEQEEAVLKAWGKNQTLKKLAIPTDYPDYMREQPQFQYSETETSQLRRKFIAQKIENYKYHPLKRNPKLLQPGPPPKLNRATELRNSYNCRQPIMSQRFRSHYSQYRRPPFRNTNVKLSSGGSGVIAEDY